VTPSRSGSILSRPILSHDLPFDLNTERVVRIRRRAADALRAAETFIRPDRAVGFEEVALPPAVVDDSATDLSWLSEEASSLLRPLPTVIPVIGSGVSKHAGLPDGEELALWMAASPLATGITFERPRDCLHVADRIVDNKLVRELELQREVASDLSLSHRSYQLTDTLLSIVHAPSRLIVTFNYDLLAEEAAAAERVAFRSLSRDEIHEATDHLRNPPGELLIVHLHGHVNKPETMILAAPMYMKHVNDGFIRTFLTALINTRTLCFMGLSLDEEYILNGLLEAAFLNPRHVYVGDKSGVDALRASRYRHGLSIADFPSREWHRLDDFSRTIFGPPLNLPIEVS